MAVAGDSVFQSIVGDVDAPVFVVTTTAEGESAGCLVGFATQCSIDPLRFLVCISKQNRTWDVGTHAETFAVHLVRPDQGDVAEHFGAISAKDEPDKLASWPMLDGPNGVPIVPGCDWFAGRVLDQFDLGDDTGFLLQPSSGRRAHDGEGQFGSQRAAEIAAGQPVGS